MPSITGARRLGPLYRYKALGCAGRRRRELLATAFAEVDASWDKVLGTGSGFSHATESIILQKYRNL